MEPVIPCVPCPVTCYPLRLHPGQEIKESLISFVNKNKLNAAFIMTCVGSVTHASLRMSDSKTVKEYEGSFEIVSFVGTLSAGGHLHASLSDKDGNVFGGHVMGNMIVYTTAEIMVGECSGALFSREHDTTTGFKELLIEKPAQEG
ncbi:bifunctional protein GlmU-like [Mytilus trossulus]|uniref:bifunctional protein GlmU-like n=1 Tax=Mytilus trossulus TaxID=6551 RepID=UPI003007121A